MAGAEMAAGSWVVESRKGVSMREGASRTSRVIGRLPAATVCSVVEERRLPDGTPRLHVVSPAEGWVTPRLTNGRVLLRRADGTTATSESSGSRDGKAWLDSVIRQKVKHAGQPLDGGTGWQRDVSRQPRGGWEGSFTYELEDGRPIRVAEDVTQFTGSRVWDTAVAVAKYFEQPVCSAALKGCRVLELGSGTGVLGCVLAALGARVTCTDQKGLVEHMQRTITANQLQDRCSAAALNWMCPAVRDDWKGRVQPSRGGGVGLTPSTASPFPRSPSCRVPSSPTNLQRRPRPHPPPLRPVQDFECFASEEWDLIVGSDTLLHSGLVPHYMAVLRAIARPRTRIFVGLDINRCGFAGFSELLRAPGASAHGKTAAGPGGGFQWRQLHASEFHPRYRSERIVMYEVEPRHSAAAASDAATAMAAGASTASAAAAAAGASTARVSSGAAEAARLAGISTRGATADAFAAGYVLLFLPRRCGVVCARA